MLEILVSGICDKTTDGNNGVETDTGTAAALSSGCDGTWKGSLGLRVTGLFISVGQYFRLLRTRIIGRRISYLALEGSNFELRKGLAGLVAVADVLEGLGGVLASDV